MTDRKRKTASQGGEAASFQDFPDPPANREAISRAERLRRAIQEAGRVKEIAERAGIPLSTLNSYLKGGEMKLAATIALAEACNVSIEWLATGRGPMRRGEPEPPKPREPAFFKLFGTVDMETMAQALEVAARTFQARGATPSYRRMAQVVTLIYDTLCEPDGDPAEVQRVLSSATTED